MALTDLDQRPISATYVCTVAKRQLKPGLTLLSLVIGANAGLMTSFLAIALWAAGHWDRRRARFSMPGRTPLTTPWLPTSPRHRDADSVSLDDADMKRAYSYPTYSEDKEDV
jgi:hypothetical protein